MLGLSHFTFRVWSFSLSSVLLIGISRCIQVWAFLDPFPFADDIDLMGGNNDELQELTDRLSNSAREYGMEISSEKSKVMVNSGDNTTVQISMNGQQLEEVMAFKYFGATLTKDGCSTAEIKIRLAIATASMAKLIWSSKDLSFSTKIKFVKTLVLSTLLYGCESWTLTADSTKSIQAFEKNATDAC